VNFHCENQEFEIIQGKIKDRNYAKIVKKHNNICFLGLSYSLSLFLKQSRDCLLYTKKEMSHVLFIG